MDRGNSFQDILKKRRYAYLVNWKPRKFHNYAQGWHSGSHAMAWAAITPFVRKVFLGPPIQNVGIQFHASTYNNKRSSRGWEAKNKLLNIKTMMKTEFLMSAINDFENGGLESLDFLKKAHSIYNEYATFPCQLPNAENPYLIGVIFSYFAKYYQKNIDYYTSILEDALFCFIRVIENTDITCSEHQCAAIRMLLLIDDNEWAMKGIAHNFFEKKCQQLYGSPLMVQKMLAQGMEPWTYEIDILKNLGRFCVEESGSDNKHSFISASEMKQFNDLKRKNKYFSSYPLVIVPIKRTFELFSEFVTEFINTPYERRITPLHYNL